MDQNQVHTARHSQQETAGEMIKARAVTDTNRQEQEITRIKKKTQKTKNIKGRRGIRWSNRAHARGEKSVSYAKVSYQLLEPSHHPLLVPVELVLDESRDPLKLLLKKNDIIKTWQTALLGASVQSRLLSPFQRVHECMFHVVAPCYCQMSLLCTHLICSPNNFIVAEPASTIWWFERQTQQDLSTF